METYVQYGCGLSAPEGWVNFDASPGVKLRKLPVIGKSLTNVPWPAGVRSGDIRRGLPFSENTLKGVYCSHVLEHLSLEDCRLALRNTYKLLKPGGIFRAVLPDLKAYAREYLASDEPDAAIRFMEKTLLGRSKRTAGVAAVVRDGFGNSEHLWMWDYPSLSEEVRKAGFASVRPAVFGDSGDEMFSRVEDRGRWNGQLGLQAEKA